MWLAFFVALLGHICWTASAGDQYEGIELKSYNYCHCSAEVVSEI